MWPDTDYVDRGTVITALAVQPDGRIVATGAEFIFGGPASPPRPGTSPPSPTGIQHIGLGNVVLFRFLADGVLDTSLAGTGQVITRVPPQTGPGASTPPASTVAEVGSAGISVALAADGSIVVGGSSSQPFPEPLVVRYTPSGLVDPSFGRAGFLSLDRGGPLGFVNALAFADDGRLVIAGSSRPGFWNEPGNWRDVLVGRLIPGSNRGTVWAWGWNGVGQLGDGTTADRHVPTRIAGLTGIVAVSASPYHSLALKGDGTVWAWGWNILGQLGDGTTLDRSAPVQVAGLTGVVAIAAGGLHSLALRGDGTVWGWGYNGYGQLGDGTLTTRLTPAKAQMAGMTSISAGFLHSLAVREEGTGWAWGHNAFGQLGDGTVVNRGLPVALPAHYGNTAYTRVSAGWFHSTSLDVSDTTQRWGANFVGQVTGTAGPSLPTPGRYGVGGLVVSAGGYHIVTTAREGVIYAGGWGAHGQLGNRTPTYTVAGVPDTSIVSPGGVHTLAVNPARQILAWGWNHFGQLGTGTTVGGPVPGAVSLANPVMVGSGGYHSLAIQG